MSIRQPPQHLDFLEHLCGKNPSSKNEAPFSNYYDALTYAAIVGFKNEKREPLAKGKGKDPITYLTMSNNSSFGALLAVFAVLENKEDHTCLSGENAELRIKVFEEYACGGLTLLKDAQVGYGGSLRDYVEAEVVQELTSILSEFESEEEESNS